MFPMICVWNKPLSTPSRSWGFDTPSCQLWRYCNGKKWRCSHLTLRHDMLVMCQKKPAPISILRCRINIGSNFVVVKRLSRVIFTHCKFIDWPDNTDILRLFKIPPKLSTRVFGCLNVDIALNFGPRLGSGTVKTTANSQSDYENLNIDCPSKLGGDVCEIFRYDV